MMNRICKLLCFILVVVVCFGGIENTVLEANATPEPKRARIYVAREVYEEFFKDFLTNEEHEYRKYTFRYHSIGDPSHFVPYLKDYGLPVLSSTDGEIDDQGCCASAELSASRINYTRLEYWFYIGDVYYCVCIGIHGDAIKDHYEALSDRQKLKFLKKAYGEKDASKKFPREQEGTSGIDLCYNEYKNVNIGNEMQPCRLEYTDKSNEKKDIQATFIKGNFKISIVIRNGESYEQLLLAFEKIRVDIIPYSELIKN